MPTARKPARLVALLESLVVALIWGSSFVIVKIGLGTVPPLTLAGLRYFVAFLALLPLLVHPRRAPAAISPRLWVRLFALGLSAYTIGNGALFWGLVYLPATTGSFLLSLSPLLILVAGSFWLREIPRPVQITGAVLTVAGSGLFFWPGLRPVEPLGVAIVAVGMVSFAVFGVLGRDMARENEVGTLPLTAIPLAFGGGLLLLAGLAIEGPGRLPAGTWALVLWLAVVNTALAYLLYNHALQVLTALEMNVMLNLTPLGTAALAWWLLQERLAVVQLAGILIVIGGVLLVQMRVRSGPPPPSAPA